MHTTLVSAYPASGGEMENSFNELCRSIPVEIGHLATLLHKQGGNLLSIEYNGPNQISDDSKHGLWTIQGNQVEFNSPEARNKCVAIHAYREKYTGPEEILASEIFDTASDIWRHEIGSDDFACGRFLALASERVNILQAAAGLINRGERPVFDVLHSVEATLRYLPKITVDDLCFLISAQHPKTKQDLAAGRIFNAIEEAILKQQELAWELHRHLQTHITDATINLYGSALLALARAGELDDALATALNDVKSDKTLVARAAIGIVAELSSRHSLSLELQTCCIAALRDTSRHSEYLVRQSAIQGIARAAVKHGELIDDLLNLARDLDEHVLVVTADHLFMNFDSLKEHKSLPVFLDVLTNLSPEVSGGVGRIDWILSRLLKDEEHEGLVHVYLKVWMIKHGSQKLRGKELMGQFEQTISSLIESPAGLEKLITEWFVSDETELASACGGLISFLWVRGFRQPVFSKKILDGLSAPDLIYLVRRMLGYVFSEEALLSLTFSLLNTKDAPNRTYQLTHAVLVQEIGRDYVSSTLEAILLRADSEPSALKSMLNSAHTLLASYIKAIDELPKLQELRPPFQLRRAISLRRSREMRKTMDAADQKSIFRQLARQIPIKAGVGWFSVENGIVGESHYLQSYSQEINLPRRSVSDPVGYAIAGLGFRITKRGDE